MEILDGAESIFTRRSIVEGIMGQVQKEINCRYEKMLEGG